MVAFGGEVSGGKSGARLVNISVNNYNSRSAMRQKHVNQVKLGMHPVEKNT